MASNELFCLAEQASHQQGSIFTELLQHYSNPQISLAPSQQKLFPIQQWSEQQEYAHKEHKSSGQWVWADDDEFSNNCDNEPDEQKHEALTTDNFQLRRVKSLRIQQQDKITMFLKKQSALSIQSDQIQEEKDEPARLQSPQKRSTFPTKSQSLSPRKCKSKKIDKLKIFKIFLQ